jgi:membrane fusion protein, multidrug efflux system
MRMKPRSERKPSTRKRMILMIFLVGGFIAVLVAWNLFGQYMAGQAALQSHVPPQTVTTMKVTKNLWQPEQISVGSLRAARGADLAFDVAGIVSTVAVRSGEEVKQGQLLVQLNADDIVAQRRQLEANAALLKTNLERARQQLTYKGISQAEFDSNEAAYKAAQAGVNQQQALIEKRELRAPFSGRVGIVSLNPGSYVNSGDAIVTLQQVDPVFVDLNVPQDKLAEVEAGQSVILTLSAFADHPFLGTVTAISPKLDEATRNIQVEASVPNPEKLLKPGMYANVAIQIGQQKEYLTLPQTAITFNPYGETVFLVKMSGKKDAQSKLDQPVAQSVFVTTGPKRGDQISVLSGIKEGDEVVTTGQLKIKNGTPLIIDGDTKPPNEAAPTPQEK